MASDRLVTPEHVLKSVMEHERRGATPVLSDLEKLDPDLCEFLLESLTQLHYQLTGLTAGAKTPQPVGFDQAKAATQAAEAATTTGGAMAGGAGSLGGPVGAAVGMAVDWWLSDRLEARLSPRYSTCR